jgi:molybdopterin synthase sulfur carrier subunit
MKVNFFATLRSVAGQKTIDFVLPEQATVRQLVDVIVTSYPLMRSKLLNEEGTLWGHVHVFVNGRDAPFLENELETVLKADDTISIFPAVGGGANQSLEHRRAESDDLQLF